MAHCDSNGHTQKGQGHDPNIFDANYLDNGWRYELRVSTYLTEQISRRFPGDSKRYFKKIPVRLYCFGLLCNVPNLLVCLNIEQKHDMYNMGAVAKIKRATTFLNKQSGTQFHHDWKPMPSIIDILHKNFQEDNTNSRIFPGFPGVVDTLELGANGVPIGNDYLGFE